MDTDILKNPPPRGFVLGLLRNRKLWALLIMVGSYFIILFVLSRLIDSRTLRKELEETTSSIFGADVTIGQVETEIKPLGGWRVRLRDIVVENASPDFDGNLFTCRKIVFEGSFTDILAGKWKPDILFKNWILQVHLLPDGNSNLSDLFIPQGAAPKAYKTWPFSEIMMAEQAFQLQNGTLRLVNDTDGGLIHETGLLEGEGRYIPSKGAEIISGEFQFNLGGPTISKGANGKRMDASFSVTDFAVSADGFKGKWTLDLVGKGAPLGVIMRLLRLPQRPSGDEVAEGRVTAEGLFGENRSTWLNEAEILITMKEKSLPLFGMGGPIQFTYKRDPDPRVEGAPEGQQRRHEINITEQGKEDQKYATVICITGEGGQIEELEVNSSDFYFSRIPNPDENDPWSKKFFSHLHKVTARVDSFRMLGFRVNNAHTITEIENGSIAKMAMAGEFCKGEIFFGTGGWPIGDTGWPKAIGVTIRDVEANSFAEATSHLLPSAAVLSPTEGRIYCTLFHIPAATDPALVLQEELLKELNMNLVAPEKMGANKGWDGTLLIKDVRFDEHGDNPILKVLWELPSKLLEVQNQCLQSGEAALPETNTTSMTPDKAKPLTSLRVTEGSLRVIRQDAGGELKLEGGFITRELGRVMMEGQTLFGGKDFRLMMRVYPFEGSNQDQEANALPELNERFSGVIAKVEKQNGLLITMDITGQEVKVTENYKTKIINAFKELEQTLPASESDPPEETTENRP